MVDFQSDGSSIFTDVSPVRISNADDPAQFYFGDDAYASYSGTDISVLMLLPNQKPLALGELQTLSYSIHRENSPVRTLGHTNPRGFVRGPRTIAGSMIFYHFNLYTFYKLREYIALVGHNLYPLGDMLPPFDLVVSFANEYGSFSKMKIFGVTIVDEGGTMSIDDLITEGTITYMARGIQPITAYVPHNHEVVGTVQGKKILRPSIDFLKGE